MLKSRIKRIEKQTQGMMNSNYKSISPELWASEDNSELKELIGDNQLNTEPIEWV